MTMPVQRGATAVLVIDMQKDNIHRDGAFAASGAAAHAKSQTWSPTCARYWTPHATQVLRCSTT
ncbi:hypothetical protein [Nocardia gipuzkoensis]|uniref:hypothetical protein n=1 Tax=Nocardia gipuzkoensis TaxID=2749991 RepID=UPI001C66C3FE|nr:hypothetical protein [Nocardia gipuzkoensis]